MDEYEKAIETIIKSGRIFDAIKRLSDCAETYNSKLEALLREAH